MRTASILSTLVLLAAAVSVLPAVSAELPLPTDIPYCITPECSSPAACSEKTYTVTADTTNTVTTHADCSIDVETGKGMICVGAWSATSEHDLGPIHWTRHYCDFPGGPLDGISTTSAQRPPPCQTMTTCCGIEPAFAPCCSPVSCPPTPHCREEGIHTSDFLAYLGPHAGADLRGDCSVDVCNDLTGCCSIDARSTSCGSLASTASSSAIELPDPCGPTAYCTGPECPAVAVATTDLLAYLGPHASASLSRDCHADVQERGLRCAIGNGEVERSVGPATVGADVCLPALDCTCDPLPVEPTMASADLQPPIYCVMAPCGPQCIVPCVPQVVPSDCELRQATPDPARTLVWGSSPSDCTVDVDPAYECVGGWGFDRHVTVAFLDVVARVCTGGPFPPPVVQAILEAIQLE